MALATVAQVEAILGVTLAGAEITRVEALIGLAQTSIENELGRPAETGPRTETHSVGLYRRNLVLDHWPIASVEDVTEATATLADPDDYTADLERGILTRVSGGYELPWAAGAIAVTYTRATIAQLSALCASIAARAFRAGNAATAAPSILAGLRQLTIGRWSATTETGAAADPVAALELTLSDRLAIARWVGPRP